MILKFQRDLDKEGANETQDTELLATKAGMGFEQKLGNQ